MLRARLLPLFLLVHLLACTEEDPSVPAATAGNAGGGGSGGLDGNGGVAGQGATGGSGDAGTGGGSGGTDAGGKSGSGGSPDEPGDLVADYCLPLAQLLCGRGSSCGCGALLPGGALDESACVNAQTVKCKEAYGFLAEATMQGVAVVWKSRAKTCIEALAASADGCARLRPALEDAGCDPWFGGDEPVGAACAFPLCAGGLGVCEGGTCKALPGEGEPCQGPNCAAGLVCLEGVCKPPGAVGSSCSDIAGCGAGLQCAGGICKAPVASGQTCESTEECNAGLACVGGSCGEPSSPCKGADSCGQGAICAAPRACAAPGTPGENCDSSEDCEAGLRCGEGTCVAAAAQGQPCDDGVYCGKGLACTLDTGLCQPLPEAGSPCALGVFGPILCADGLGCIDGTCGPLPGKGKPCAMENRCSPEDTNGDGKGGDLGCDFTADGSFCNPRRGPGSPCQNDAICTDGLYCDGKTGTCAAALPSGSPCSAGNECGANGTCQPSSGSTFACAPLPGAGSYCLFDCEKGLRCRANAAKATCLPGICTLL